MTAPPDDVVLAVDFGGTKVEAALVSDGRVLPGTRSRRPTGPTATSAELDDAVRAVVAEARGNAAVAAVGIGSAGPVDTGRGTASPLNVPAWRDHPFRDLVSSLVPGVPIRLAIDGLCITLAEHRYGAARGFSNAMGMVVSTGVGGGLVLHDAPVEGSTGNAGHIGHVEVAGFDDPCLCGGRGCLEAIASGPNSVRWAQSQGWTGATGEDLAAAAPTDAVARAAIERSAHAVGLAIASATSLLDLDVVAVGGGFSHSAPDYLDLARAALEPRRWDFVRKVRIVAAGLGSEAPLIGAALIGSSALAG